MLTRYQAHLPHLRRALRRRRRLLALLLACAAAMTVLPAALPVQLRGREVLVAARDLEPGTVLAAADLRLARVPQDLVPGGEPPARGDLVGRTAAMALPAGIVLGSWALAPDQPAGPPPGTALMAVPVPPALAARLAPGTRVELFVPDLADGSAREVRAEVVEAPAAAEASGPSPIAGGEGGAAATALLAVEASGARDVAHAVAEAWIGVSVVD